MRGHSEAERGAMGSDEQETGTDTADDTTADAAVDAADLRAVRLAKVDELRARGIEPYPHRFERDHTVEQLRQEFGGLDAGEETEVVVRVAGRIMLLRGHGKLIFATVRDQTGSIQLFVSQGELGRSDTTSSRRCSTWGTGSVSRAPSW
ncbi:MAG: OB-fold nucleic acid binding domain-containing protein [Acidimicrobiia bacterium]|nr:OB-fold nucleic acid binding domain-containing protein [Acidimicrobiia bacterium]